MKCEADQRWAKRAIGFQHFDQIPAHVIEAILLERETTQLRAPQTLFHPFWERLSFFVAPRGHNFHCQRR